MTWKPDGRLVHVGDLVDMTLANTFDITVPDVITANGNKLRGFMFAFYEVTPANVSSGLTIRFEVGSLLSSGYNMKCIERVTAGGTGTITTLTTDLVDVQGVSNAGDLRGWVKGYLSDEAADNWFVNGRFYDDADDSVFDVFSDVAAGGDITGFRVQSADVTNYADGFFGYQFWT